MKYENFQSAKELIKTIDEKNRMIEDLESKDCSIVFSDGLNKFLTVGVWPGFQHPAKDIILEAISKIVALYKNGVLEATTELETL